LGHDIDVVEVDRPNRQERARKGKSDPVGRHRGGAGRPVGAGLGNRQD
jgi:hypothetical protein